MKKVFVDIETASAANLKKVGAKVYANDPSTIITTICAKEEDGELFTWINPILVNDLEEDTRAIELVKNAYKLVAHNASFEYNLFSAKMPDLRNWKLDDFVDTATWSNICRGGTSLEHACMFFDTKLKKDEDGHKLMMNVSKAVSEKPKNTTFSSMGFTGEYIELNETFYKTSTEIYTRMGEYCANDVIATEQLFKEIRKQKDLFTPELLQLTQKGIRLTNETNEKGIKIDLNLVNKFEEHQQNAEKLINSRCIKEFNVSSFSKRIALKNALNEKGLGVPGVGKLVLKEALKENPDHKTAPFLKYYLQMNRTAMKKATKAKNISFDGRIFDTLKFAGAATTGRWSAKGFQIQNLPGTKDTIENSLKTVFDSEIDNVNIDTIIGSTRGMLIPDEGCNFFIGDLKQIEPRLCFLKLGRLDVIEKLDSGWDIYQNIADKAGVSRQAGKVAILQLQYGAGKDKFFETLTKGWGIDITRQDAERLYLAYHFEYPEVKKYWYKLEKEMNLKRSLGSKTYDLPLLSGRKLRYDDLKKQGMCGMTYKHYSIDLKSKKIRDRFIYGSLLFQHSVQSDARDIMLAKVVGMYEKGYNISFTVHDEIVVNVPKSATLEEVSKDWKDSGQNFIEKHYKGLTTPSDCVILERYWSH